MPTDEEVFATAFLVAPLLTRDEYTRRTTRVRVCLYCDETVFRDNPLKVAASEGDTGHDPDCRALFIFYNGFDGNGGPLGTAVTLARADILLSDGDVTLSTLLHD